MKYYLKRLGHQELGSVKNGKAQRGRRKNDDIRNAARIRRVQRRMGIPGRQDRSRRDTAGSVEA